MITRKATKNVAVTCKREKIPAGMRKPRARLVTSRPAARLPKAKAPIASTIHAGRGGDGAGEAGEIAKTRPHAAQAKSGTGNRIRSRLRRTGAPNLRAINIARAVSRASSTRIMENPTMR
jgi:hypothetical protein